MSYPVPRVPVEGLERCLREPVRVLEVEVDRSLLRPVERVILGMRDQGLAVDEIAERLRRSPDQIGRIMAWTEIPRSGPSVKSHPTPLQRRVLHLRSLGEDHISIGRRFRKSPRFIRQVEGLALYRMGLSLLSDNS